jgi:hypothetical protein
MSHQSPNLSRGKTYTNPLEDSSAQRRAGAVPPKARRGYERVTSGAPEPKVVRERRQSLESILQLAIGELQEGRDPTVVAKALRNALVTA